MSGWWHMSKMSKKEGFTIVEVLISIAILSIIMAVIYRSFTASTDGIKRAERVDDLNSMVRVIFLRLINDINGAYLSGRNVVFVGEAKRDKELPQDSLDFTSLSNQIMIKDSKESNLHEIGYYLKDEYDYQSQKNKIALYRREKKDIGIEPVLEGGKAYELTDEIAGVRFAYFDGSKWREEWDSRTIKALPKAVEAEIIFLDKDKRERVFKTIIDVPMGSR